MKTFNGLPIYMINIDEAGTGMSRISLVDEPAVEHDYICFSEEKQYDMFKLADEEKHCISGVVCLADVPIYRMDSKGRGYYIVFSKEVIEEMTLRYSQNNLWNSVSLQHDDKQIVDSVIMTEFFIKNTDKGINPVGFEDVTEGSLFATFKVLDDTLWKEIKESGKLNGFSLEIMANLEEDFNKQEPLSLDEEVAKLLR